MAKKSEKGLIVCEYLESYPEEPSLRLARMIYAENSNYFDSLERVRSMVRYYRGNFGEVNRKAITDKKYFMKSKSRNCWEGFPTSDHSDYEPYILPKNADKILLISDVHIPYHDEGAVKLALKYGKDRGCNTVFLNGDILDFYASSSFQTDPRKRDLKNEIDKGRQFLQFVREMFPDAFIYYLMGNHEERWERWLYQKLPDLAWIEDFQLSSIFRFGELRINEIKNKRRAMCGKLAILHGHEFGRQVFSPVNPARGLFLRAKHSLIAGHYHQTSEHTESNIVGKVVTCWSTGCLCYLHPEYMPINKWNHGFAYIEANGDSYDVDNLRIVKSKIV